MRRWCTLRIFVAGLAAAGLLTIGVSRLARLHISLGLNPYELLISMNSGEIALMRMPGADVETIARNLNLLHRVLPAERFGPAEERRAVLEYIGPARVDVVPAWGIAGLFAVLFAAAVLIRRRRKPHACRCGYDLTGNVSGRCPECGRGVEQRLPAVELARFAP